MENYKLFVFCYLNLHWNCFLRQTINFQRFFPRKNQSLQTFVKFCSKTLQLWESSKTLTKTNADFVPAKECTHARWNGYHLRMRHWVDKETCGGKTERKALRCDKSFSVKPRRCCSGFLLFFNAVRKFEIEMDSVWACRWNFLSKSFALLYGFWATDCIGSTMRRRRICEAERMDWIEITSRYHRPPNEKSSHWIGASSRTLNLKTTRSRHECMICDAPSFWVLPMSAFLTSSCRCGAVVRGLEAAVLKSMLNIQAVLKRKHKQVNYILQLKPHKKTW